MTSKTDITFVSCVESGPLETQTIRMMESLRRWGGRFVDAPLLAVTPRFGSPLSYETHKAFERLNVKHIRFQADNPYSWKGFLNKHFALAAAEEYSDSEFIGWLDSDLLIVDEPNCLILEKGEDFAACASDKNIGTVGPEDEYYSYWQEACRIVGIDIEDLPWIVTEREKERIRLYFNSGVFVYRRSTQFAQVHLEDTIRVFDSRITSRALKKMYFTQHILGMTMIKMGLSWRALPHSHNYGMGSKTYDRWYKKEELQEAKIVHYHDAMWPWFWQTFIDCLRETHPEAADWLKGQGTLKNEAPLQWRLMNKVLKKIRSRREIAYTQSCQRV